MHVVRSSGRRYTGQSAKVRKHTRCTKYVLYVADTVILCLLSYTGHNSVVQLLVSKGAQPDLVDQGGLTSLHWAALFGLTDTAKILMDAKSDINAQTKTGETPLHLAAEKGKIELVKYLLECGCKTDIRDKGAGGGATAYDAATRSGQKEISELLKPAGSGGGGCCIIQ